jgi:hypothetical protein
LRSVTTRQFRRLLGDLPDDVRRQARQAYKRFRANPRHPGLRFKRVHATEPIFSVRVSREYRAVAIVKADTAVWFFIGHHDQYMQVLASL